MRHLIGSLAVVGILLVLAAAPAQAATGVYINGGELTVNQVRAMVVTYGFAPPQGRFWYDARSGAWGLEGHETAGFILPGHNFGRLAEDASMGNTGVFINGRELNMAEAMGVQRTFGAVYRGRWWLDGRTGYWGREGNPMPLGNIIAALRAQRGNSGSAGGGGGGGGDNFWTSRTGSGNWNGDCGYINLGGGDIVGTGSCR